MTKNNWIIFIIFAIANFSLMAFVYVMKVEGAEKYNKNIQLGIKHLKKAIEIDPDYTVPQYNLGVLYYHLDDFKKAMEQYNILLDMKDLDRAKKLLEIIEGKDEGRFFLNNDKSGKEDVVKIDNRDWKSIDLNSKQEPNPKSKRIWILAGFIGGIILYTLGYLTGFRFCDISWQEKETDRQKREKEYADYLSNPDKNERTDFNFNGEEK